MRETVQHQGELYERIDPAAVDLDSMTEVQKVADVYAYQVKADGCIRVQTLSHGIVETENVACKGDWVVYNLENGIGDTLEERLATCDVKVITEEAFEKLYARKEDAELPYPVSDKAEVAQGILEEVIASGSTYGYIGKSIMMARVPFNFVIRGPWGSDQFIKAGGYLVYNTNTSTEAKQDIYGLAGAHHRKAGNVEKTYTIIGDGNMEVMEDVYKFIIKSGYSPIADIQFKLGKQNKKEYDYKQVAFEQRRRRNTGVFDPHEGVRQQVETDIDGRDRGRDK